MAKCVLVHISTALMPSSASVHSAAASSAQSGMPGKTRPLTCGPQCSTADAYHSVCIHELQFPESRASQNPMQPRTCHGAQQAGLAAAGGPHHQQRLPWADAGVQRRRERLAAARGRKRQALQCQAYEVAHACDYFLRTETAMRRAPTMQPCQFGATAVRKCWQNHLRQATGHEQCGCRLAEDPPAELWIKTTAVHQQPEGIHKSQGIRAWRHILS